MNHELRSMRLMRLKEVIKGCLSDGLISAGPMMETEISNIAYDSRRVTGNGVFVALQGENCNGNDFIGDAIKRGAKVIISDSVVEAQTIQDGPVFIKVKDARLALACLSNNLFGRPSERLNVIGVTGTNGKTTTTHLIRSILESQGKKTGLIGTISYSFNGLEYPAIHTTPEAVEFQSLLKDMLDAGCSYVITEVSSHSLKQKRVDYTRFSIAVFTNLTMDHLDFHRTMDDYYLSKRRLFTDLMVDRGIAAINIDDEWGKRLLSELRELRPDIKIITYGLKEEATISPLRIEKSKYGSSLIFPHFHIDSPLIGLPNIYNILSAISVAKALNIPDDLIRAGLEKNTVVRGRFERIEEGQDFLCIIDYAHTPDALERLIMTAREIVSNGRVVTVFGCGGNRDRGKRPVMGRIATGLSDHVIITTDNPRNEDTDAIISDIITGITKDNYEIIPDREKAIKKAIGMAARGDILLIAGKGHEDYQEIKGKRVRFSDRDICINALRERICRV